MFGTVEEQAIRVGNSPSLLWERLVDAYCVLSDEGRNLIRGYKFDFENKRFLSYDGQHALQWRVRERPDEPVSYKNQQTNRGSVFLVKVTQ